MKHRNKVLQKSFSLAMALLMAVFVPLQVAAAEVDHVNVAMGNVVIVDNTVSHFVTPDDYRSNDTFTGSLTIIDDVTAGGFSGTLAPFETSITVTTSQNIQLTFDNVSIREDIPVSITASEGATVTIELDGENTITGGDGNGNAGAAFQQNGGSVIIQDESGEAGTLEAESKNLGSGILSLGENAELTINADVTATGAAGFGGIEAEGSVNIEGGTVTASGGASGSVDVSDGNGGIQTVERAGSGIDAAQLNISGGTVTASGGSGGENAGAGIVADTQREVNISGGDVTATGGSNVSGGGGVFINLHTL